MRRSEDFGSLVKRMFQYARALEVLVADGTLTRERLGRSVPLQWMVTTPLQQIGEAAWLLDKQGAELGHGIPLRQVAALRHRLVHHYDGTDWNLVEDVIFEDVPELVQNLRAVMNEWGLKADELNLGVASTEPHQAPPTQN